MNPPNAPSTKVDRWFKPLTLAVWCGVLAGCASPPPAPPANLARGDNLAVQRYAAELITHSIATAKVPGISIALVDDQRLVWSSGFGYADVQAQLPATADTLYRVGSISKLFTDTAAVQLAERGMLNLDEPVQHLLPGFAPRAFGGASATITPRQLMTHHSGLQRDVAQSFQSQKPPRFTEMTDRFNSHLTYQPGELLAYSNVGLSVLGSVVERLSNTPFEAQLQRAVLGPLGMSHSAFDVAASPLPAMSNSYKGSALLPAIPLRDVPAGGLNSSVTDLSRFMAMVFANGRSGGQQVLQPASVAEMLRPQNLAVQLDVDTRVGLGWFLESPDKARIQGGGWAASHGGAIDGYRSHMILLPEHTLGIVVLGNSSTGSEAVETIARQVLAVALEAKTGIRQPAAPTDGEAGAGFVDTPLAPEVIAAWVGNYTTLMGYVRIDSNDGKSLQIDALGHTAQLRQRQDGRFGLHYRVLGLLPVNLGKLGSMGLSRRTLAGRDLLVAHDGPREALAGEKMAAVAAGAEFRPFIEQHLGKYEVVHSGDGKPEVDSVRLLEANGLFIAEVAVAGENQALRIVLTPVSRTQALALGPLADRGDMVEALPATNGQVDIQALGLTFRRVAQP